MDLSLQQELLATPDLRHRVRQLRYFRTSFHRCADLVTAHAGYGFAISDARLTAAFLNWAEIFDAQKNYSTIDRRDFAAFASGLLLQELLRERPVEARRRPLAKPAEARPPLADAAIEWPAGLLATSYCLSVLNAVAAQDFGEPFRLSPAARDPRIWQSFRENIRQDPASAVGFLDLFVGNEPNWAQPDWAPARPSVKRALARASRAAARLH